MKKQEGLKDYCKSWTIGEIGCALFSAGMAFMATNADKPGEEKKILIHELQLRLDD